MASTKKKIKNNNNVRVQAPKLSNQPTQVSSPQAKGSSLVPKRTSSSIPEPGYKRTFPLSGEQATRIKVFKLCFT